MIQVKQNLIFFLANVDNQHVDFNEYLASSALMSSRIELMFNSADIYTKSWFH